MAEGTFYTLAEWRVTRGREDEFIAAWRRLAEAFSALPAQPIWGTLVRSEREPTLFYSFGPWPSEESIARMRADPIAQVAIARAAALCDSATPGAFRQVEHVDLRTA